MCNSTEPEPILTPKLLAELIKRSEEPSITIPPGLVRNREKFRQWLKSQNKK